MNHSFNTAIAKEIGLTPAVLLENIAFWILKNEANQQNFFDGDYWTFSSIEGFSKLFDYLTAKQIRTALQKLLDTGYIKTGNYNKSTYDRTKWYALTGKSRAFYGISNCEKEQIHLTKKANGSDQNGEPIPDITKDTYTPYSPPARGTCTGAAGSEKTTGSQTCVPDKQKTKPETTDSVGKAGGCSDADKSVPPAAREILDYLNAKTNSRFEPVRANMRLIEARLKEGASPEKIRRVIDAKCEEWGNDDAMRKYLRPATLFAAKNFAQYAGQLRENRYAHLPPSRRPVRRPL